MIRILLIFIGVFFLSIQSNAQIPGYMGKKFSLIYSGGISVPHLSNINSNVIIFTPTTNHSFKFEYIFSKRSAIGIRYKLGLNSAKNPEAYKNYIGYEAKHKFQSNTFGIYLKSYKRGKLAPIGPYSAIGLNFQQLIVRDIILTDYYSNLITKETNQNFDFNVSFAAGRNWIIVDYLLLGFEVEIAPSFGSVITLANFGTSRTQNGEKINITGYRFNMASEVFKVSLNIGIIPF